MRKARDLLQRLVKERPVELAGLPEAHGKTTSVSSEKVNRKYPRIIACPLIKVLLWQIDLEIKINHNNSTVLRFRDKN